MDSLPIFVRLRGDPVLVLGEGDAAEAKRRLVRRAGGAVTGPGDPSIPRLAFIAIEDPERARVAANSCRRQGMLVNVVDQPELCDFTTPAIVDRDPVLIAVGTGGASAGLAKQIRLRLEALLPAGLGELARALFAARGDLRKRWPDGADRRRALDAALAPGGTLDPLRPDSACAVTAWIAESANQGAPPREYSIYLLSDDPDDLTLRNARMLGEADVVLHSADVPGAVLARARADARIALIDDAEKSHFSTGLTVRISCDRPA
jgi:uroporphyrin-III C-methyltransferase / precorrin-2 dehydrogenase / sirohydrochlorin ferrochelatase